MTTSVTPISSALAASSTSGSATSPPPTVDYTQFLQLLVAELQNQDPTSPTDPTQYMSQLASFSSVEQQVQTNSTLDALLVAQTSSIIGDNVTSADGKTTGTIASLQLSDGGGATVTLTNGQTVTLGPGVTISAPSATTQS
ncbi:MAG TPA: flagellar hook assembly protein FlgD [Methylocella sp.]|nr:flagellar hook assembly protein FlgD [Methylocella sp.]